jgi:hypothetical protein
VAEGYRGVDVHYELSRPPKTVLPLQAALPKDLSRTFVAVSHGAVASERPGQRVKNPTCYGRFIGSWLTAWRQRVSCSTT